MAAIAGVAPVVVAGVTGRARGFVTSAHAKIAVMVNGSFAPFSGVMAIGALAGFRAVQCVDRGFVARGAWSGSRVVKRSLFPVFGALVALGAFAFAFVEPILGAIVAKGAWSLA